METALAILMVLGIFVGIPALIGFAIAGTYIRSDRRVHRAERAKAVEEMVAEAHAEAVARKPVRKRVKVA
ncbi:hypothetical protein ACFLUU_00765 [Chloroflexota bacterium]